MCAFVQTIFSLGWSLTCALNTLIDPAAGTADTVRVFLLSVCLRSLSLSLFCLSCTRCMVIVCNAFSQRSQVPMAYHRHHHQQNCPLPVLFSVYSIRTCNTPTHTLTHTRIQLIAPNPSDTIRTTTSSNHTPSCRGCTFALTHTSSAQQVEMYTSNRHNHHHTIFVSFVLFECPHSDAHT